MSTQGYVDMSEDRQGHNDSAQHRPVEMHDPARDTSYHHSDRPSHHERAEQGHDHELVYSKDSTFEKGTIPHQDPHDPNLARRRHADPAKIAAGLVDTEKGPIISDNFDEENPQSHSLSSYYARYRIFVHLLIWLFFTGSVVDPPCSNVWEKLLRLWNDGARSTEADNIKGG